MFEPDLLRTFLAFAEAGALAQAAKTVGRTPSAVTAQMQRLEAQVGEPLLVASGRGRVLTPAGEALVSHARQVLAAHRAAWLAMKGARAQGHVRLGCTQDFADSDLPDLLRQFAGSHARVRVDLRVGRSQDLTSAFEAGDLDVLLVMRGAPPPDERATLTEPMVWLTARSSPAPTSGEPLPLALLDPPCGFRTAALSALADAGRPYRLAATSASLSGLRAAVRSGLALTPRTRRMVEPGVIVAPDSWGLPRLPEASFTLRCRPSASPVAQDLALLLAEGLPLATRAGD